MKKWDEVPLGSELTYADLLTEVERIKDRYELTNDQISIRSFRDYNSEQNLSLEFEREETVKEKVQREMVEESQKKYFLERNRKEYERLKTLFEKEL